MRLDDYAKKDGKRVWLTLDEMNRLIDTADSPEKRVAFMLAGKAGLRREEIVSVTPNDFKHADDGFLRIWSDYAKRDKYREAPVPDELEHRVSTLAFDQAADQPVVDVVGSTVYRWVRRSAEQLQAETDNIGWSFLDVHDLRRSWGGHLLWNCGLMPSVVMEFGGWEDWETFREHYLGSITPEAAQRERAKIDYIGGSIEADELPFEPRTQAAQQAYFG